MSKYKEYADLKKQAKDLADQIKIMEGELFEEIAQMDGSKLETKFATFTVMYRPKWKYSDELLEKEKLVKDKVKLMKKEEEIKNIAVKISDNGSLRCQLK